MRKLILFTLQLFTVLFVVFGLTACPQTVTDSGDECVTYYFDADGDGFGNPASSACLTAAIDGYVANADDCDDTDKTVGAAEVCDQLQCERPNTDPLKSDCDGDGWPAEHDCDDYNVTFSNDCPWIDADGDGFLSPADCDDTNAAVNPLAAETCDGVDNDCDGKVDEDLLKTWYRDADGDGFGNDADKKEACAAPTGYVEKGGDCNDADATKTTSCSKIDRVQKWGADDEIAFAGFSKSVASGKFVDGFGPLGVAGLDPNSFMRVTGGNQVNCKWEQFIHKVSGRMTDYEDWLSTGNPTYAIVCRK